MRYTIDESIGTVLSYFPKEAVNYEEGTYDQYLSDLIKTVKDNFTTGNYQVCFFYMHLIFMSYVYYSVNKAYLFYPQAVDLVYYPINAYHGRDDKPSIEGYTSIYDFSKIPEKEIFKVFYALGMNESEVAILGKYVKERDDYAHATGKGNIDIDYLESSANAIISYIARIQNALNKHLEKAYIKFLLNHYRFDYFHVDCEVDNFIVDFSLSEVDINFLCNLGISKYRDSDPQIKTDYRFIKNAHCVFIEHCINLYDIDGTEAYKDWITNEVYVNYRYADRAKEYISDVLDISEYECVKDGEEFPLYECPNCGEEQLVYIEKEGIYKCFHCGFQRGAKELTRCCECGELFETEDEIICPKCLKRKMQED